MDPCECLGNAKIAAIDGRYDEALQGYVWFHEHALEHDPAYYGVRLSFALAYWIELGEAYPRAIEALKEIRNSKTQVLLDGGGDRNLFHDVEAINESLQEESSTHDLFKILVAVSPDLAQNCASLALPALVKCRDFHVAYKYIGDPSDKIIEWSKTLNEDVADLDLHPQPDVPALDAYEHMFVERVNLLIAVLAGVGRVAEAVRVSEAALVVIDSVSVRASVKKKLLSPTC
jgi:hypothetical protein